MTRVLALSLALGAAITITLVSDSPSRAGPSGDESAASDPSTPATGPVSGKAGTSSRQTGPAAGGPAPRLARIATAIPSPTPSSFSFVGPSGQIYDPQATGTWQRRGLGGISADVQGAIRTPSGAIFAVGDHDPIYRYDKGIWHVHLLPNRGPAHAPGANSEPVLAIGRHVYAWQATGWSRLAGTRSRLTALWGHIHRRQLTVTVATESGKVLHITGSAQKTVRDSPGPRDPVVMFFGRDRDSLFALTRSGVLLEVGVKSIRRVELAPSAPGLSVHAGMVDRAGVLWVAGSLPRNSAAPAAAGGSPENPAKGSSRGAEPATELVLARLEDSSDSRHSRPRGRSLQVSVVKRFSHSEDSDRIRVIRERPDGMIIVATKNGAIHMRSGDGTWHNGKLIDRVAAPAPRPATSGPARAR